jgi:hypothetical protein
LKSQIVAVGKRPQRMIQEVIRLNPELQLHRLLNLEILEESQV